MTVERLKIAQAIIKDHPFASICGGFIRDAICGKPHRDIDFYIPYLTKHTEYMHLIDQRSWATTEIQWHGDDSAEYVHQAINGQAEYRMYDDACIRYGLPEGTIINVINLRESVETDAETVTGRFNFGICQAGVDKDKTYISEHFRKDYKENHITLLREDWGYEASMKQYIKLWRKGYEWPLRLNPHELPTESF